MNQNERKTVVRRMILLIAVACAVMGLSMTKLVDGVVTEVGKLIG